MEEASTENKEHDLSKYDKIRIIPRTRKFLPISLLRLVQGQLGEGIY